MRAVVVDDEPLAREGMRLMLAAHPDVVVVGEAATGTEALSLAALEPDLWLVDVEMPESDGLALARALGGGVVVFVTAHESYAIGAFDVAALDYLLKPVDDRRLAVALDRVRALQSRPARIEVRDRNRTTYLDVDAIGWIEAADYYVEIHAGGRVYLHREPLQDLEQGLGDRFVRIHRSRLVNREHIAEVRRDAVSGEVSVVLLDGVVLGVSRSCRSRLRR